ncbi:hypothetical protein [Nonomuraea dietziae]|uniref:hypothetical protein n=1 Tax=Nonomuraea dietziae TaxID=65515 RepID=UPI0031D3C5BE
MTSDDRGRQPPTMAFDVAANARDHSAVVRAGRRARGGLPRAVADRLRLDAPRITCEDPRLIPIVEACAETGSVALAGASCGASRAARPSRRWRGRERCPGRLPQDVPGRAESERFQPGEKPSVLEVDGWRLGLGHLQGHGRARQAAETVRLGMDAYVAGVCASWRDLPIMEERARRVVATTTGSGSPWPASPDRREGGSRAPRSLGHLGRRRRVIARATPTQAPSPAPRSPAEPPAARRRGSSPYLPLCERHCARILWAGPRTARDHRDGLDIDQLVVVAERR